MFVKATFVGPLNERGFTFAVAQEGESRGKRVFVHARTLCVHVPANRGIRARSWEPTQGDTGYLLIENTDRGLSAKKAVCDSHLAEAQREEQVAATYAAGIAVKVASERQKVDRLGVPIDQPCPQCGWKATWDPQQAEGAYVDSHGETYGDFLHESHACGIRAAIAKLAAVEQTWREVGMPLPTSSGGLEEALSEFVRYRRSPSRWNDVLQTVKAFASHLGVPLTDTEVAAMAADATHSRWEAVWAAEQVKRTGLEGDVAVVRAAWTNYEKNPYLRPSHEEWEQQLASWRETGGYYLPWALGYYRKTRLVPLPESLIQAMNRRQTAEREALHAAPPDSQAAKFMARFESGELAEADNLSEILSTEAGEPVGIFDEEEEDGPDGDDISAYVFPDGSVVLVDNGCMGDAFWPKGAYKDLASATAYAETW
jgi:hypothetical protein